MLEKYRAKTRTEPVPRLPPSSSSPTRTRAPVPQAPQVTNMTWPWFFPHKRGSAPPQLHASAAVRGEGDSPSRTRTRSGSRIA